MKPTHTLYFKFDHTPASPTIRAAASVWEAQPGWLASGLLSSPEFTVVALDLDTLAHMLAERLMQALKFSGSPTECTLEPLVDEAGP